MQLPEPGDQFEGRYRIDRGLGEGAFARVYRAYDQRLERNVALKVLAPGNDGYSWVTGARFRREASTIAQLQDPHTLTMFDVGQSEEGLWYMACEFVEGEDLRVFILREGAQPPAVVAHILKQLLESLREAHQAGVIHRDIKPANVFKTELDGDPFFVKLGDFGLAKSTDADRTHITRQGSLLGTPRYMSPEQVLALDLDPRSDLYSLGLVAYELLTGEPAIDGETMRKLLRRHLEGPQVEVPEQFGSPGLRRLIAMMTRRRVAERYGSAAEVLRDLRGVRKELGRVSSAARTPVQDVVSDDDAERNPARAADGGEAGGEGRSSNLGIVVGIAALFVVSFLLVAVLLPTSRKEALSHDNRLRSALVTQPAAPRDIGGSTSNSVATRPDAGAATNGTAGVKRCEAPFRGLGTLRALDAMSAENWLTFIPEGYGRSGDHPLVVFLHEVGVPPQDAVKSSRLREQANRRGLVVVAPEDNLIEPWGHDGDVARIQTIVEDTIQQLCIDPSRVLVLGHGRAGLTVDEIGLEDWVSGTAVYGYGVSVSNDTISSDAPPRPHIRLTPTQSRWIPFDGGNDCYGHRIRPNAEVEERWRARNDCSDERTEVFRHDGSVCYRWNCRTPFESCHVDGGSPWPGGQHRTRTYDFLDCDGPLSDFPAFARIFDFHFAQPQDDKETQ